MVNPPKSTAWIWINESCCVRDGLVHFYGVGTTGRLASLGGALFGSLGLASVLFSVGLSIAMAVKMFRAS